MAKAKKEAVASEPEDLVTEEIKAAENEALEEAELDTKIAGDQESSESQEISLRDDERETATEEQMASEVAAINTDNDTAKQASKKPKASKTKKSKQSKKATETKVKSKKYQETIKDLDKRKEHSIEEAVELVKKLSYSKFDGTITLDVKLSKARKGEEAIRGTIKLPHSTGKISNVVVVTDDLIEKIKAGYSDFDVLITSPEMMPKLGQVAKILGPKGKMPNPKDGTVVANPEEAAKEISLTARYRMDAGRNLHIAVGKVSFEEVKLIENTRAVLKALAHLKKDAAYLSPTMGPGVKIAL